MFRFITTAAAAEDPGSVCQVSADLGEFGVYDLELSDGSCTLTEKLAPVSANLALLVVFLVFAAAGVLWWALNRWAAVHLNKAAKLLGWDKVRGERGTSDASVTVSCIEEEEQEKTPGKTRLRSLDTFRGLAIIIMIFVNDGR